MSFTDFSRLRRIIEDLGVNWDELTRDRLQLLWQGEIISAREELIVTRAGLLEVLPDGNVIKVIVHAPQGPYRNRNYPERVLMEDPEKGWHKFHVLLCSTVQTFKSLRKTNRNDGNFTYPLFWREGQEYKPELRDGGRPLLLCKNCAKLLENEGVRVRVDNFDVKGFLASPGLGSRFSQVPTQVDFDLVPNVYAEDWPRVSKRFKEMRNWTCEKCSINLSDHRRFLHAHHRDEHKANNVIFNLQALCIRCHAGVHPQNSHLNGHPDLAKFERLFPRRAAS